MYGIKLQNNYNETILDENYSAYHVIASGTTKSTTTVAAEIDVLASAYSYQRRKYVGSNSNAYRGGSPSVEAIAGSSAGAFDYEFPGSGVVTVLGSSAICHPTLYSSDALVFFDLGTATVFNCEKVNFNGFSGGIPNNKSFTACRTIGNNHLSYYVVDLPKNLPSPSDTSGLVVKNGLGEKVFDSRLPTLSILEVIYLDDLVVEYLMGDVNTASSRPYFDIKLRRPTPGWLVSAHQYSHLRQDNTGQSIYGLGMSKIDDSTLRLQVNRWWNSSGINFGADRLFIEDSTIIIGKID